jgi:hypothetical protein
MSGKKVKVLLVSLDFPSQIQKNLIPFIQNNRITASILWLNDPDANAWINKVDPSWSGSIPAALIYKGSHKFFFEKELTCEQVYQAVTSIVQL